MSQAPTQPTPQHLSVAGFDAAKAIARMMNNTSLWWRALAIFHAHYARWEESWGAAQAAPDAERKCVHALRSSAANVGADHLAAAAAALENALMQTAIQPHNLTTLRAQVLTCFQEVRQSAQSALDLYAGASQQ